MDLKIVAVFVGLVSVLYFNRIDYDDNLTIIEGVYFNATAEEFFEFVTDPPVFSKWFRWPTRVSFADDKIRNRKYFVGIFRSKVLFETSHMKRANDEISIGLKARTFLRPTFELKVMQTCTHSGRKRLKMIISIDYRRNSMLFHWTMGRFLKSLSRRRMLEAVDQLEYVLNHYNLVPLFYLL